MDQLAACGYISREPLQFVPAVGSETFRMNKYSADPLSSFFDGNTTAYEKEKKEHINHWKQLMKKHDIFQYREGSLYRIVIKNSIKGYPTITSFDAHGPLSHRSFESIDEMINYELYAVEDTLVYAK